MKKSILIILFATISAVCSAQINQIASISGQLMFSGADANMYYTYLPNGNSISIYNWNGSLYRTVSVTPPSGYSVQTVLCLSKKIINNDDKVEMCVVFVSSTTDNSSHKMWLINEDGTKLNDFGNAYSWSSGYASYNGENHLNVYKVLIDENYNVSYTTIIYNCSGTGSLGVSQPNNTELGAAFPNPANNTITLPYKLNNKVSSEIHIFDANGHLLSSIPVGAHFNEIKLDISSFPAGIYIYECDGITNRFVVQ